MSRVVNDTPSSLINPTVGCPTAWFDGLMDVSVVPEPDLRRYLLVSDEGSTIGRIDYRERDGVLTMWHTEVDKAYGGRGYGAVLVKGALDDVRARGLTVRPTCPFIASYIERHPNEADLVAGGV